MSGRRNALGRYGEDVATRHLIEQGLVVLDRNWRCESGEIDLVLREGNTLVICEVKTRASARFGDPLEAVTQAKAGRLRALAEKWMENRGLHPPDVRFDVVGVLQDGHGRAEVNHVRGIA